MKETKNPEITHYQKLGNLIQVYHLKGFPGHLDGKESATMQVKDTRLSASTMEEAIPYLFFFSFNCSLGVPRWHSGKESTCQCRRCRKRGFNPWVGKIPWSRKWPLTPVFLPEKFHGQRGLVGYTVRGVAKNQTRLSD